MEKENKMTEVKPVEKLKVTKADIVVAGTADKPYYNIHYREIGNDYDNIGFGSYNLDFVFKWREECLEIVKEAEKKPTWKESMLRTFLGSRGVKFEQNSDRNRPEL